MLGSKTQKAKRGMSKMLSFRRKIWSRRGCVGGRVVHTEREKMSLGIKGKGYGSKILKKEI